MKDLVVIIQTRQRSFHTIRTIEMLYSTCSSKNNFDIFCIIDEDDVHTYEDVQKIYPELKWKIVPHIDKSWVPILQGQYEIILPNDYYFNWVITDDFRGLTNNWDVDIITKKNTFEDGLFVLYTSSTSFNRDIDAFEKCYIASKIDEIRNGYAIINFNEMLPICTKKWAELMWDVFEKGNYSSSRELITASLIYKLKKEYNINRHVRAELSYNNLEDDGTNNTNSNHILNDDGLNRDDSFEKMIFNNFKPIEVSLNKMHEYVTTYKK